MLSRIAGAVLLLLLVGWAVGAAGTERVSVATGGGQGDRASAAASISADGRFVAFRSSATSLVPGDTNDAADIFVHDRQTGTTERVSVAADGSQADGASDAPSISADGRFVAFASAATNLVPGDTNGADDVFVHDRQTGATERVSVAAGGAQGDAASSQPSLSADGRLVAFVSYADNLVPGDSNRAADVFVRDRTAGTTTRVSVATDGTQADGDSFDVRLGADGQFVAFDSVAANLVPGDTNASFDVFLHDRQTGATARVSVASDGTQSNADSYTPGLSTDGRFVAFQSYATNLVPGDTNGLYDVFLHDLQTGATERDSIALDGAQGNAGSYDADLSADGAIVTFKSGASTLVPGDTNGAADIFVRDRRAGTLERASVADDGAQANGDSSSPRLSASGEFVAFESDATNLAPGDTNGVTDVFVRDRGAPSPPTPTPASPTATPPAPSPTPTGTPTPAPAMPSATPSLSATATATPPAPSATPTPPPASSATPPPPATATGTPSPPATATVAPCAVRFADVPPAQPFYPFVQCLACAGIVSGYDCGAPGEPCPGLYFRPGAPVTRAQLAKIVATSAGFAEPPAGAGFADVPPTHPFYLWIMRLAGRGLISGYACGGPSEPCDPARRPYFRSGLPATRGQIAKIVAGAAGLPPPTGGPIFADIPPAHPFYPWITALAERGLISGYTCGGSGEPCDDARRPYFRAGLTATRAQTVKIDANAFGC